RNGQYPQPPTTAPTLEAVRSENGRSSVATRRSIAYSTRCIGVGGFTARPAAGFARAGAASAIARRFLALLALPTLLQRVQACVRAAAGEQRVVRAALDDPAGVHHEDLRGVDDRAQAMRDHECRAAGEQAVERLLDEPLALGVER